MRPFLVPLVLVLLFAPASAQECVPSSSQPEVDTGETPFGRFYVDNDLCQLGPERTGYGGGGDGSCLFSIWTYQESNGIDGLQRGDEVRDDTCGGEIESDTLAFY